jgi:hypothetical protein
VAFRRPQTDCFCLSRNATEGVPYRPKSATNSFTTSNSPLRPKGTVPFSSNENWDSPQPIHSPDFRRGQSHFRRTKIGTVPRERRRAAAVAISAEARADFSADLRPSKAAVEFSDDVNCQRTKSPAECRKVIRRRQRRQTGRDRSADQRRWQADLAFLRHC